MTLCIDGVINLDSSGQHKLFLPPQSKCALFFSYYPNRWNSLKVIVSIEDDKFIEFSPHDDLWNFDFDLSVQPLSKIPNELSSVSFPALYLPDSCLIICGLTSVIRALVQKVSTCDKINDNVTLLGRCNSCLKACKEMSKWGMFCEVTMPNSFAKAINQADYSQSDLVFNELSELFDIPAHIHNRNKLELDAQYSENIHPYLEGSKKTLVDIVCGFYVSQAARDSLKIDDYLKQFPALCEWMKRLSSDSNYLSVLSILSNIPVLWCVTEDSLDENESHISSLIKGIEKLEVTSKNVTDLQDAVSFVDKCGLEFTTEDIVQPFADWDTVSAPLHPSKSGIPAKRLKLKCQQLENLISCIISIAKPGDCVVDFCSGSGHLGLVLGSLLPQCKIILLDNKEESLMRAEQRIEEAGLKNVYLYKGNLVNYRGPIDVGAALHACGASTDLVMEMCFAKHCRGFVISPCCYGSIKPNKNIIYPRSDEFRSKIPLNLYSKLSHSADMFDPARCHHQSLALRAMNIIDSDRMLLASSKGYKSKILKMTPHSCTPKNNVLVGYQP